MALEGTDYWHLMFASDNVLNYLDSGNCNGRKPSNLRVSDISVLEGCLSSAWQRALLIVSNEIPSAFDFDAEEGDKNYQILKMAIPELEHADDSKLGDYANRAISSLEKLRTNQELSDVEKMNLLKLCKHLNAAPHTKIGFASSFVS